VVFLLLSVLLFAMYKLMPVDVVEMYTSGMQQEMTPAEYERYQEAFRIKLGLDQPIPVQYAKWMGRMLTGDFGTSVKYRRPVIEIIKSPMAATILLNAVTMIFVFAICIPLGISTAVRKGKIYDNSVQVVTILGYSLPTFIIALTVILLFSLVLGWTPISGMYTPGTQLTGFAAALDRAKHMILPVGVMTFTSLASLTRYIRATMIDALRMDYIRTARAKGLREKVVIYGHAFRNSLIPFITVLIGWFLGMFGGSVMVESIFNWNGMGKLLIDSITGADFAVAMALEMFYVIIGLVGNLIIDLAYTVVDPRVRLT
jgi:peptide/nickel transport system permease protein